jgi:hypothetical protein
MQGRSRFTRAEIEQLRRLIGEKQTADRSRQKAIRARLRRLGCYITDFAGDYAGFVVSDLDDLIARHVIDVVDNDLGADDRGQDRRQLGRSTGPAHAVGRRRESAVRASAQSGELEAYVREARRTLARSQARPIAGATVHVPRQPGLYAIHAEAAIWEALALGAPPDDRPLYLGKAEDTLISRDLKTHFGDGRTGHSTFRRSLAALLHDVIGLRGMPRNPDTPAYFASYGLSPAHDAALTRWMNEHVELATWPKPDDCPFGLETLEKAMLVDLRPPLNLQGVSTPWTSQVMSARRVMADEARAWTDRDG